MGFEAGVYPFSMTTEQINRIVSLRKSGKGYDTIALETGISKSTISSFCKKNGLSGKASNKVEEIVGNSLLSSPSRGNVDAGKKPESLRKSRRTGDFKVTVSFAGEPNEAALAEALRILTNMR